MNIEEPDSPPKGGPEQIGQLFSAPNNILFVVGIGASAGGLEAFTDLIRHLPPDSEMAFVLVQHLDPHHESVLPQLLAGKTEMPVVQVHEETAIRPNFVYIIPPNKLMLIRNRALVLEPRTTAADKFHPIDSFFQSLAEEFRSNAIGVVLSGAASDGTLGLRHIKAKGGVTFAQNQTAKFESMPQSAIAAGVVDFILPPRRIAEELLAISRSGLDRGGWDAGWVGDGTTLQRLLITLRNQTGVDFTQYKQPTILRRINRRMVLRKAENLEQYLDLVQKEPAESKALFDDMLISVTDFFRDPEVFEAMKQTAFASVVRNRREPGTIRVWIPACSSGEEVYSVAIALMEYLESEDLEWGIQIFGTDISEFAIAKARAGIYSDRSVQNLSPERLRRFFVHTESAYQISRSIRDICIFSRHNLARDPPLARMDLISCRNLLIYFSPTLQRRIFGTFAYALQPSGCLILGTSETLGGLSEYFETLDEKHRIYCRKPIALHGAHESQDSGGSNYRPRPPTLPQPTMGETSNFKPAVAGGSFHAQVNQLVLSLYGPAGMVVDESLRIVEYRGDPGRYLAREHGPADDELMSAVRQELRAPLSSAIEQARRTNLPVTAENAGAAEKNGTVSITVVPLSQSAEGQYFLILFGQAEVSEHGEEVDEAPAAQRESNIPDILPDELTVHLKQELKSTREYLQSVVEELRSANEEAQSANEELQSTNEEMQTSKEELQSSNEELNTINAEMQSRNSELAQLNDDLINVLGSMNMPIVITGRDLRIRRFTPVAERVLHLIVTDVGRPITDLKPRINVSNLEEILQRVLDTLEPHEQEVQDQEGRLYLMRIRPYRTADNRIDGAVLQLLDVSDLKRSLEEAKLAREYAEAIVNTVREPLVVLDRDLVIQKANRAFYYALSVTESAAQGQTIFDVARGQFDVPRVRMLFEQLNDSSGQLSDIEIEHQLEDGGGRTLLLNARRISGPGQGRLILMAFEDITERKRAAEARYRRLFESAWDGIVLVDAATGEILDLNPFTERLLGYSRSELLGRQLWDVEPMQQVPTVRAAMEQIRDQGVLRFDELTLRTRDGHDIQAEVIANIYREGGRRAIQFNIRDVTERKKFERKLQETQKLEGLGLLAGGIAHDFNNLLTGILGNASLAYSEMPGDQPARKYLREIAQAGERAAFLTRQMLAYAGKGRFVMETLDLGELVQEISTLVRTSIPKSVELRLDLARNLPRIEADPGQMQQVIMNLVINGAEAVGEDKTGKVEIRTSLRELNGREAVEFFGPDRSGADTYLQLEIRDTGSGMDEETKARIFDPFFTTKFTGRGLGLAAVQGIIKRHGGALRVYSTLGHGTTFLILLPAAERRAAPVAPTRPEVTAIPAGSVALVVDDEEVVRNLISDVLIRAGMKILTAENGREGIELFRAHHRLVSVVILDLMMPVLGGEEALTTQIKEIDPSVPVILSSGFGENEAARRFSSLNPASFLQKPYTSERLINCVAGTLARGG